MGTRLHIKTRINLSQVCTEFNNIANVSTDVLWDFDELVQLKRDELDYLRTNMEADQ